MDEDIEQFLRRVQVAAPPGVYTPPLQRQVTRLAGFPPSHASNLPSLSRSFFLSQSNLYHKRPFPAQPSNYQPNAYAPQTPQTPSFNGTPLCLPASFAVCGEGVHVVQLSNFRAFLFSFPLDRWLFRLERCRWLWRYVVCTLTKCQPLTHSLLAGGGGGDAYPDATLIPSMGGGNATVNVTFHSNVRHLFSEEPSMLIVEYYLP